MELEREREREQEGARESEAEKSAGQKVELEGARVERVEEVERMWQRGTEGLVGLERVTEVLARLERAGKAAEVVENMCVCGRGMVSEWFMDVRFAFGVGRSRDVCGRVVPSRRYNRVRARDTCSRKVYAICIGCLLRL